jgi:hypothetical protein
MPSSSMSKRWGHQEPQYREHRIASYNKGCRCDDCRAAARKARKRHRDKKRILND